MTSYTPDSKLFKDNWNLPDNPFPFLGADQYREEQILSLFEVDQDATLRSFSLQNSIIEGSFGTGKTMLLKAIYAFHYSRMILDIADRKCCSVIPVYIRFSDLPHNSTDIYRDLILNIYKKCLDTRFLLTSFLHDKTWFDRFKSWLTRLTSTGAFPEDKRYLELSSASVIKKVSDSFSIKGAVGYEWLQSLSIDYEKKYETEITKKPTPGIADIQNLFVERFRGICDRLLFLIDEVDRLPNEAFQRTNDTKYSLYETFLNQLRTSENILYKVAVYPGTASSQQVEGSRIGTRIKLGFDVKDPTDFIRARDFYYRILKSYLSFCAGFEVDPKIYFLIEYAKEPEKFVKRFKRIDKGAYGDSLEQLIFGSQGVVRRFIKLAGDSMLEAVRKQRKKVLVGKYDVYDSMRAFGKELVERLQENERARLDRIAYFCIKKQTYRFRVPGNEELVYSLYDPRKQDNVLYPILDELRRGIIYIFEFDYCYCLYRNIPTHTYLNAEKINNERSLSNGKWIVIPATVPKNIIDLDAKLEGVILNYDQKKGWGFIEYLPGKDLYFHSVNVLSVPKERICKGLNVLFRVGTNFQGECAVDVEIK